ncbi:precorrin-2 dehydrogenase/sirohydrochlorin ferrochelatase family protein [Pyrodictium abyssi]|uniref:precorrin-2 dehydrogenase/sirohydrochlorin ferrochelatase family protein n=1 Tax=Pyrodictium abyssi TaxID=54256 RepID=UPI0030C740B0
MRVPLWLEMDGRRVLVVGGGGVGTRRALWFRQAGAVVRVVGLSFSEELQRRARGDSGLELVELDAGDAEALRPHVEWADIVVVATDNPSVNEAVWRLARSLRRWVNDATDAERTEIVVPYTLDLYGGGLRVAVTTEGRTGVAARHARDRIRECLEGDKGLGTLYEAMWRVKPVLKRLIPRAKDRVPIYYRIDEDSEFQRAVERGSVEEALRAAARVIAREARRLGVETDADRVYEMLRSVEKPISPL